MIMHAEKERKLNLHYHRSSPRRANILCRTCINVNVRVRPWYHQHILSSTKCKMRVSDENVLFDLTCWVVDGFLSGGLLWLPFPTRTLCRTSDKITKYGCVCLYINYIFFRILDVRFCKSALCSAIVLAISPVAICVWSRFFASPICRCVRMCACACACVSVLWLCVCVCDGKWGGDIKRLGYYGFVLYMNWFTMSTTSRGNNTAVGGRGLGIKLLLSK